jgi:hypothetical protein
LHQQHQQNSFDHRQNHSYLKKIFGVEVAVRVP